MYENKVNNFCFFPEQVCQLVREVAAEDRSQERQEQGHPEQTHRKRELLDSTHSGT